MVTITSGPGAIPTSSRRPNITAITQQAAAQAQGASFFVNPVTGVVAFGASPAVEFSLPMREFKREAQREFLLSRALGGTAQQLGLGLRGSAHLGPDELAMITALRGAGTTQERVAILKGETPLLTGPSFPGGGFIGGGNAGGGGVGLAPSGGGLGSMLPLLLGGGALVLLLVMLNRR